MPLDDSPVIVVAGPDFPGTVVKIGGKCYTYQEKTHLPYDYVAEQSFDDCEACNSESFSEEGSQSDSEESLSDSMTSASSESSSSTDCPCEDTYCFQAACDDGEVVVSLEAYKDADSCSWSNPTTGNFSIGFANGKWNICGTFYGCGAHAAGICLQHAATDCPLDPYGGDTGWQGPYFTKDAVEYYVRFKRGGC